jgi:2-oxoglutarate ferredoxin oxidoreductase subunit alpha
MYFAGRLFKILCIDFKILEEELKELKERFKENIKEAKEGYDEEERIACKIIYNKKNLSSMNGNQGISEGAIKSGLDIYYAYPMTPATNVLGELAEKQIKNNILVLELESEIAVINSAIGSVITGAKAMIGTSGGGFDLMTESLSLTGIAEIPLVIYLASRPGPSTGVATYTGQGDLQLAKNAGHGEFNRIVLAPGDPKECEELISQSFYFSQKFKIPAVILSDKHLAESIYTLDLTVMKQMNLEVQQKIQR